MSNGFALWKNNIQTIGWGELALGADGVLDLRTDDNAGQVQLDPSTTPYLDVYTNQDWLCALGGADRHLILGWSDGAALRVVARLERLDHGEQFDFESFSARFYDVPGCEHSRCVLAWELGVALIDRTAGLVWSHVHHDIRQRLMRVTADHVELRGIRRRIRVDMSDGAACAESIGATSQAGEETIGHWMRGIAD